MLGLSISENNYRMLSSVDIWPGKTFSIRTRSFAAVMRLLSMGVDSVVNAPDPPVFMNTAEELFAKMADAPDGSDLTESVDAIFRVHCKTISHRVVCLQWSATCMTCRSRTKWETRHYSQYLLVRGGSSPDRHRYAIREVPKPCG